MSAHTPRQVAERLEIAILTSEQMRLHWIDEHDQTHYMTIVLPLAIEEREAADYLRCKVLEDDAEVLVRIDLIQNLPTPTK
ncbi:hypothetical protein [Acidithiobacillus sp. AMEEHan]|uniref:hypothetical protein n=1 Tax=Acidithiobacillus sp. AMEEHan TaxID=2994951 RepID=UPI0027E543BB|nr:hypothetical protein [Acidithiobacillus sp. AMEEHan]